MQTGEEIKEMDGYNTRLRGRSMSENAVKNKKKKVPSVSPSEPELVEDKNSIK